MTRGLIKATAYYNNAEARRAYIFACILTDKPPVPHYYSMGYRKLDKLRNEVLAGTKWAGMTDAQLRDALKTESEKEI